MFGRSRRLRPICSKHEREGDGSEFEDTVPRQRIYLKDELYLQSREAHAATQISGAQNMSWDRNYFKPFGPVSMYHYICAFWNVLLKSTCLRSCLRPKRTTKAAHQKSEANVQNFFGFYPQNNALPRMYNEVITTTLEGHLEAASPKKRAIYTKKSPKNGRIH